MNTYEQDPQKFWNDVSKEALDKTTSHWGRESNEPWEKEVLPYILRNGHRGICLDAGCGPGRYLPNVAKHFEKIIAVDFSEKRIELAKQDKGIKELSNVDFHCSDISKMDFIEDDSVDVVFTMAVLMHQPKEMKGGSLREIRRVLKPEGRAVLTELFPLPNGAEDCPKCSLEEWRGTLKETGFEIVNEIKLSHCLFTVFNIKKEEEKEEGG